MPTIFDTVEKPTLLLDEDAARANICRMMEKVSKAGIRFRPHFKTHQSAEIGEWFRAEGLTAITVSSVDMALYFADHGWEDITIAFPANLRQAGTLAALAERVHLGLLVESGEAVSRLAETIHAPVDLWLKIDAGAHRTGLAWDQPEAAAAVIEAARRTGHFSLRGLLTHAGNTYASPSVEEVVHRYTDSATRMDSLRRGLEAMGYGRLEVSVGDTPGASLSPNLGAVDELRPGNFVFYDSQQIHLGSCQWQDVAVALACPIVALHPERNEAIVYGGAVHLSKDFLMENERRSYGYICFPEGDRWSVPLEGAYVSGLSQEHGILKVQPGDFSRLRVGDLACILPAHSCLTVTLMKRYLTLRGRMIDTLNV